MSDITVGIVRYHTVAYFRRSTVCHFRLDARPNNSIDLVAGYKEMESDVRVTKLGGLRIAGFFKIL